MLAVAFCALCGVIFLGCFDIENPKDGVTFQHRAKIHFSINATSPSNVKWTTTYTDENGQSKTVDIGQGGSFDYDGLPIVNGQITKHLIQAKRGSDHKEVTIYIKPWCMYPDSVCNGISDECNKEVCDPFEDKCLVKQKPNNTSCSISNSTECLIGNCLNGSCIQVVIPDGTICNRNNSDNDCNISYCKSGNCITTDAPNGSECRANLNICESIPRCIHGACYGSNFTCVSNDSINTQNVSEYCDWFCRLRFSSNDGIFPYQDMINCKNTCNTTNSFTRDLSKGCYDSKIIDKKYDKINQCDLNDQCSLACGWLMGKAGCKISGFDSEKEGQCNDFCSTNNEVMECIMTAFYTKDCRMVLKCSTNNGWSNPTIGEFDYPKVIYFTGEISSLAENAENELRDISVQKVAALNMNNTSTFNFLSKNKVPIPSIGPLTDQIGSRNYSSSSLKYQKLFKELSRNNYAKSTSTKYFYDYQYLQSPGFLNNVPIQNAGTFFRVIDENRHFGATLKFFEVNSFKNYDQTLAKQDALSKITDDITQVKKIEQEIYYRIKDKVGFMFVATIAFQPNPIKSKIYIYDVDNKKNVGSILLAKNGAPSSGVKGHHNVGAYVFPYDYYYSQRPERITLDNVYYYFNYFNPNNPYSYRLVSDSTNNYIPGMAGYIPDPSLDDGYDFRILYRHCEYTNNRNCLESYTDKYLETTIPVDDVSQYDSFESKLAMVESVNDNIKNVIEPLFDPSLPSNEQKKYEPIVSHSCGKDTNEDSQCKSIIPVCDYSKSIYNNKIKGYNLKTQEIFDYPEQPYLSDNQINQKYTNVSRDWSNWTTGLAIYYDLLKWRKNIDNWHKPYGYKGLTVYIRNNSGSGTGIGVEDTNNKYDIFLDNDAFENVSSIYNNTSEELSCYTSAYLNVLRNSTMNHHTLFHELGHYYQEYEWAQASALEPDPRNFVPENQGIRDGGLAEYIGYMLSKSTIQRSYGFIPNVLLLNPGYSEHLKSLFLCQRESNRYIYNGDMKAGCNKNGLPDNYQYFTNAFSAGWVDNPTGTPEACAKKVNNEKMGELEINGSMVDVFSCGDANSLDQCDIQVAYARFVTSFCSDNPPIGAPLNPCLSRNCHCTDSFIPDEFPFKNVYRYCYGSNNNYAISNIIAGALSDVSSISPIWNIAMPTIALQAFDFADKYSDFRDFETFIMFQIKLLSNASDNDPNKPFINFLDDNINQLELAFAKYHSIYNWYDFPQNSPKGIPLYVATDEVVDANDPPPIFEAVFQHMTNHPLIIQIGTDSGFNHFQFIVNNCTTLKDDSSIQNGISLKNTNSGAYNFAPGYAKCSISSDIISKWYDAVDNALKKYPDIPDSNLYILYYRAIGYYLNGAEVIPQYSRSNQITIIK